MCNAYGTLNKVSVDERMKISVVEYWTLGGGISKKINGIMCIVGGTMSSIYGTMSIVGGTMRSIYGTMSFIGGTMSFISGTMSDGYEVVVEPYKEP